MGLKIFMLHNLNHSPDKTLQAVGVFYCRSVNSKCGLDHMLNRLCVAILTQKFSTFKSCLSLDFLLLLQRVVVRGRVVSSEQELVCWLFIATSEGGSQREGSQLWTRARHVEELETARKLQLYTTSIYQVHSFVCQLDYKCGLRVPYSFYGSMCCNYYIEWHRVYL